MKRSFVVLGALTAATALAGWSKSGEPTASFSGNGPAGFKIEGTTKALDVKDDGKTVTVTVGLKDLTTGIGLRDKHMREKYIEVDKYPEAKLEIPLAVLKLADGDNAADGKGTFTVHGKTKEVSFKYKASCKAGTCDVDGTADVNLKDFEINVPSYMGVTVKPDIVVHAVFQMKKG